MALAATPFVSLESGDRMDSEEFHRRYEARPDLTRAELVEGVVYVTERIRYTTHDDQASLCVALLSVYAAFTPDVRAGANASIMLDDQNEVQPDAFLFHPDSGRLRIRPDEYLEGAPELVVEVAASTVSRDLHDKYRAYERNGVLEYVVWRVLDREIDWFVLEDGRFQRRTPAADGIIVSPTFPGLRLDTRAMLTGDDAAAIAAVQAGG